MPNGNISKRSVDALTCPAGRDRHCLWDNELSGFGVVAFPSGKKVYVAQYRAAGRSRRFTIGQHGRLTPEQARNQAKVVLGSVVQGFDPIQARRVDRAVPTFGEIADQFLSAHVESTRKGRTLESYELLLRLHVRPAIGNMRVTEIRRSDVSKLHRGLGAKHATANRAVALVSAVWNWASREHEDIAFPGNPAKGVSRHREEGRERFLSREELGRLGDALVNAETIGIDYEVDESKATSKHAPRPENRRRKLDPYAIAAIRLLIFTGARLREILQLTWDEVDFDRGLLNVPAAKSKTGKKVIFLPAAALAILSSLPRALKNDYVIAGGGVGPDGKGKPRSDLKRPWAAIVEASQLPRLRLHDLRHSFASMGAAAQLGLPMIGKLLGHRNPATTQKYAHLASEPLKNAADLIGNSLNAALQRSHGAEVLPLRSTIAHTAGGSFTSPSLKEGEWENDAK